MPFGIGGAAVGGGFGLIQSGINYGIANWNNQEAARRESRARYENYLYNEQAANYADIRTRALYNDLYSVGAQMSQIKKAGLSPSLFYGDAGGISGQSGAQGAGASGISPQSYGMSPVDISQAMLNAASAEKIKAETKTINETREPQITKLLAEAGATEAAKACTEAQAAGIELDNYVKENTKDANIYTICEKAEQASYATIKMYNEMRTAKVLADLNEETYDEQVKIARLQVDELVQSITESKSRVSLNDQQKQYLRNEVLKSFDEIAQGWKQLDIAERQQESYTEWLEKRIPQIEKELEIKLKELGVQKTKIWVDAIKDTIRGVCTAIVVTSSFKGGNPSYQPPTPKATPKSGGNALNQGVPAYKQNGVWEF